MRRLAELDFEFRQSLKFFYECVLALLNIYLYMLIIPPQALK